MSAGGYVVQWETIHSGSVVDPLTTAGEKMKLIVGDRQHCKG